ncbi:MAG: endolytic transglycosylase MltG [Defluviitaleaceae bacterium]|nr:endolytic transglycosylase MltG [Defluviitaleaceae bacterium]
MKTFLNIVNYLFGSIFNIVIAVAVVIIAYNITVWAFDYGQGLLIGGEGTEYSNPVVVEIPEDATTLDIARILRENELITNEFLFVLQSQMNGSANFFRTGVAFHLNTNMSDNEIMDALQRMPQLPAGDLRITVIEGITARQIGEYAQSRGLFSAADFMDEVNNGIFSHRFLDDIPERENRLEGFLFPDTYNLPPNPTPRDLIVRQLNRFQYIFAADMWIRMEYLGLSLDEVMIIASIVEREARLSEERPIMASLIFNRLAQDMPLEMYSTLTFAMDRHRSRLLAADFHSPSPFNTFNRAGLPAGPISNPGLESIMAVLFHNDTNYLYFQMMDYATGEHFFAETYEEIAAVRLELEQENGDNGAD